MNLKTQILRYFDEASGRLSLTYDQVAALNFDVGIQSKTVDGVDRRRLVHPIVVAAQRFLPDRLEAINFSGTNLVLLSFPVAPTRYATHDYLEMRYILEGELFVDFDGRVERFNRGEFCLIGSHAAHRDVQERSSALVLNVHVDRLLLDERLLHKITLSPLQAYLRTSVMRESDAKPFLRLKLRENRVVSHGGDAEFLRLHPEEALVANSVQTELSYLFGETHYQLPGYADIQRGHVVRLFDRLTTLYRSVLEERDAASYEEALYRSVELYMRQHLEDVSLEDLAREFSYHPNYFNGLIRRHAGVTYSALLIRLRIARARELLESTDLPVDQVCMLVGYQNRGFFYRKFTEGVGMSPAAYRSQFTRTLEG